MADLHPPGSTQTDWIVQNAESERPIVEKAV
jgi:hypothetical protein